MDYILTSELTDAEQMAELDANLARGNHQSATSRPKTLMEKLYQDVKYGFAVPILASIIKLIPNSMVQPCGIARRFALKWTGLRVLKDRLTHDLTWAMTKPNASINNRCDITQYPKMIYGWYLLRCLHYIVALRNAYLSTRILISKYNFSDAYRRIAYAATAAAQTIIACGDLVFIALRLSFRGSVNPPSWCCFSEMVTDLSNKLAQMRDWDPDVLHSPVQPSIPIPVYKDNDIPIAQGRPLAMEILTTGQGRGDCFVDDIVKIFLAFPNVIKRHAASCPLAAYVLM